MTALRTGAAAVLGAAALAGAGCGEDRSRSESTDTVERPEPPPLPAATFAVAESEFRIAPRGARLDRPAKVEVHVANEGRRRHALAVRAPGGLRRTRPLDPGASAVVTVTLDRPGRYVWFCPLGDHESRGMRGAIVVKEPAPAAPTPAPGGSSY